MLTLITKINIVFYIGIRYTYKWSTAVTTVFVVCFVQLTYADV